MRILLVNQYADLPGEQGTGRHAAMAQAFNDLGADVVLVRGARGSSQQELPKGLRVIDVPVGDASWPPWRLLQMRQFQKRMEDCSGDIGPVDLVIGSSVHLHAARGALRIAKQQKVPFVFEARDLWPEVIWSDLGWSRRNPVYRYLKSIEKELIESADMVVSAIPGIDKYIFDEGYSEKEVFFLPNGIDPALAERTSIATGGDYLTIWGSHGRLDNLWTLIPIARHIAQMEPLIRIRIVGDGPYRNQAELDSKRSGVTNIEFLDRVPRTKLWGFANDSFAFGIAHKPNATVSRYGTGANKINEYLALGLPCIGIWDVFADPIVMAGAGVRVAPGEVLEAAEAICHLWKIRGTAEWSRMGASGQEWVKEHRNRPRDSNEACRRMLNLIDKGKS